MRIPGNALKSIAAGLVAGAACFALTTMFGIGAADFGWSMRSARDLLAGRDPYGYIPGPNAIPYPLPAALVALPLAPLGDSLAGAIFIAVSVALLTWGMLQRDEAWRMGMFFSWPFIYSVIFVQWSPLMCAMWFLPGIVPLLLAKPNIGLPVLIASLMRAWSERRRSIRPWIGPAAAAAVILIASILIYPAWPWVWLRQISTYQGTRPPLLSMPLGPIILVSLFRWRDYRSWFIVAMALTPQRMVYDQLALLLIARNTRELFPMVMCTWIGFLALIFSPDMANMPGSWRLWAVLTQYLPAVTVLLWPDLKRFFSPTRGLSLESAEIR